jgi:Helix-turn-helix.
MSNRQPSEIKRRKSSRKVSKSRPSINEFSDILLDAQIKVKIYKVRQASGLSTKEIAKKMGVSQAKVANIEKNGIKNTYQDLSQYMKANGTVFELKIIENKMPDQIDINDLKAEIIVLENNVIQNGIKDMELDKINSEVDKLLKMERRMK